MAVAWRTLGLFTRPSASRWIVFGIWQVQSQDMLLDVLHAAFQPEPPRPPPRQSGLCTAAWGFVPCVRVAGRKCRKPACIYKTFSTCCPHQSHLNVVSTRQTATYQAMRKGAAVLCSPLHERYGVPCASRFCPWANGCPAALSAAQSRLIRLLLQQRPRQPQQRAIQRRPCAMLSLFSGPSTLGRSISCTELFLDRHLQTETASCKEDVQHSAWRRTVTTS